MGQVSVANPGWRFFRRVWEFPDELCFLSFSHIVHDLAGQHLEHASRKREHPSPLELPTGQRFVRDLHRRPAIREPGGRESRSIYPEPFHGEVHLFVAAVRVGMNVWFIAEGDE